MFATHRTSRTGTDNTDAFERENVSEYGSFKTTFDAMGTNCEVVVFGSPELCPALLQYAHERVFELEQCWSRFLPHSDISLINNGGGEAVQVRDATVVLIMQIIEAWNITNGACDATVHASMVALGYDRSIVDLQPTSEAVRAARPSPGCGIIGLDERKKLVRVPKGVQLDAGGIGKGLAADLVYEELRHLGAEGAMVNMGGDLRAGGTSPTGTGWPIGISHPNDDNALLTVLHISDGAVVTTTPYRRMWERNGATYHHLIDPRTGESFATNVRSASVVSNQAWFAEAIAKEVALADDRPPLQVLLDHEVDGLLVVGSGGAQHAESTPGLQAFLRR